MSHSLTFQDLGIVALGVTGLLSTAYVFSNVLTYLRENFVLNESDYPRAINAFHHPFVEPLAAACHIGANGVFSLLTGICVTKLDALGYDHEHHDFDPEIPNQKRVYYYGYIWEDYSVTNRFTRTSLYHAFVYYDGYVYQSYRTKRHSLSPFTDAYPLVRMKVKEDDRDIFLNTSLMTPAAFNRLCAPSSHPIPLNANLRCCKLYSAGVDPTRTSININRKLEK